MTDEEIEQMAKRATQMRDHPMTDEERERIESVKEIIVVQRAQGERSFWIIRMSARLCSEIVLFEARPTDYAYPSAASVFRCSKPSRPGRKGRENATGGWPITDR
jgi:hypothetical protein